MLKSFFLKKIIFTHSEFLFRLPSSTGHDSPVFVRKACFAVSHAAVLLKQSPGLSPAIDSAHHAQFSCTSTHDAHESSAAQTTALELLVLDADGELDDGVDDAATFEDNDADDERDVDDVAVEVEGCCGC